MGTLPRSARLSFKAPEIADDSNKMRLTTPFTAPDQAALVARVLLTLDEAVRR
jgi:predicted secreted protein